MAGRRRVGQGRMDAAVDHFAPMGYDRADVRKVINGLLKNVYGKNGWPLLEDNCYQVVQEALLEKQEQEEKLQLQHQQEEEEPQLQAQEQQQEDCQKDQGCGALIGNKEVIPALLLEDNCYNVVQEALFEKQEQEEEKQQQQQQEEEEEAQDLQELGLQEEWDDDDENEDQNVQEEQHQEEEQEEDDEDQQQEAANIMGAPSENDMPILEVQDEVPGEAVLAVEQTEVVPMLINPPVPKASSPHPAATGSGRTRRPCYGWISESESDSDYEEYLASRNSSFTSRVQEEAFLEVSGSVGGM